MNKSKVVNSKGEKLDIDVIFSFTCKENNKNYIAVNNNDDIFEKNSRYRQSAVIFLAYTQLNVRRRQAADCI